MNLDAFGGEPVISAEIGAVPQANENDIGSDLPSLQTCREVILINCWSLSYFLFLLS